MTAALGSEAPAPRRRRAADPAVVIPSIVLGLIVILAVAAPLLDTIDPVAINPTMRNKASGVVETLRLADGTTQRFTHWMGTDSLGRDVYSRVLYGARVSLIVGTLVAVVSVTVGLAIGMLAGYLRVLDAIVMRVMDGLMAIPPILLAIGVVSLSRAGLPAVVIAIAVPEIPRVVRLVRAVVLSIREEPYVEAAVTAGTPAPSPALAPCAAQLHRAAHRAGDLCLRFGDRRGVDPVFSRHRYPARDTELGQRDGERPSVFQALSGADIISRRVPGGGGSVRQPAR